MRATLLAPSVRIQPGVPATLDIEVTNTSDVIDGISAEVFGLDPAWVPLAQPVVTLFPDATGTITINFRVPPSCAAGESMITVRVFSTIEPSRSVEHLVWITVEPKEDFRLAMVPSLVEGGSQAEMQAVISNTGNIATEFSVTAMEPTRALECEVIPPTVWVRAGEQAEVTLRAWGRRPWFGSMVARNIEVTATAPSLVKTEPVRFMQKPRIPRGVITALILAAIVALWATIFLLVVQRMRAQAAPAKAVPATWVKGTREVKVADVQASVSGTVVTATDGKGIARITVEALRKNRAGVFESAASVPTGDDGTYSLSTLLPGTYQIKFSADGFDPIWFGAPTQDTAQLLPLAPLAKQTKVDAVISGVPGILQGAIATPQGKPGPLATVTLTPIETVAGQVLPPPQIATTDGPFAFRALPTPATYDVRIERPGFAVQVSRVEMNGGQQAVIDTASLVAADGTIIGKVVDGSGQGLGNVKIVLRSGSIEKTVLTPTTGDVGGFTLDGLPTPRTYVITFTRDGYTSTTVALDLAGGETRTVPSPKLFGGAGTVKGTARDAATQNPLGGVKVVVAKGAITAETATLTTGVGTTGAGTYSVTGLPIPGSYTVTFSLDGYRNETRQVGFLDASSAPVVDVELHRVSSTLNGTVSVTGGAAGLNVGLNVELSDGTTQRTASTTSSPAGFYSFSDVPDGTYTVRIFGTGVVQHVVLVTINQGVDVTRDITVSAT